MRETPTLGCHYCAKRISLWQPSLSHAAHGLVRTLPLLHTTQTETDRQTITQTKPHTKQRMHALSPGVATTTRTDVPR